MPVTMRKIRGKWRVVEAASGHVAGGSRPKDGGGHASRAKALAQVRAINAGIRKKRKR